MWSKLHTRTIHLFNLSQVLKELHFAVIVKVLRLVAYDDLWCSERITQMIDVGNANTRPTSLPFQSFIIMIKAYMHVVSVLSMMLELPVLELLSKQDTYTAVDVS